MKRSFDHDTYTSSNLDTQEILYRCWIKVLNSWGLAVSFTEAILYKHPPATLDIRYLYSAPHFSGVDATLSSTEMFIQHEFPSHMPELIGQMREYIC